MFASPLTPQDAQKTLSCCSTPIVQNSNHQSFVIKPLKLPSLFLSVSLFILPLKGTEHISSPGRRRRRRAAVLFLLLPSQSQTMNSGVDMDASQKRHSWLTVDNIHLKTKIINLSVSKWRGSEYRSLLGDPGKLKGMNRHTGLQTKPPWEQTDSVRVKRYGKKTNFGCVSCGRNVGYLSKKKKKYHKISPTLNTPFTRC